MKRTAAMRWQFLTSTISTTMVLLLLGALVLFMLTAREIRRHVRQDLTVTIILADTTSEYTARNIEAEIAQKKYIHHVNYISSEQALQEQIESMGVNPKEVLGNNPFSISMELRMKDMYACSDSLLWITDNLYEEEAIIDVIYQKELIENLNKNLNTISVILLGITIMLSVISVSLINSTVHLSVYSRRFIINNMKLIGARWAFIRRPFLIRGLCIGVTSTIIANGILLGLLRWSTKYDDALTQFIPKENIIMMALSVLTFALVITLTCTYISVTRFLRMKEKDLYK
ncbi:MAG: permease-like cell division protein FtsX [Bacteroidaceae bacterium]|nr:permease-like cell division protein FtsX [Bacteroidaceae bacterium]